MTDKQIAVKVDHVSKYFKLPTEATNSLRTALVNRFKGIKGYKEQHVLKDISFEVEKGDFFGILGRNGSGKSTLLKIISEIYVPEKVLSLSMGNWCLLSSLVWVLTQSLLDVKMST